MKIESYSPTIRRKEMDAVLTTLVGEKIGPGEQAARLVQIAKEFLQFDFCLALRSPATALNIALQALDIPEGGGVVLSALSPRYYARVIDELRLVPLYCDVEESSACMSQETVSKAVSLAVGVVPRCILINHTLGFVPDTPGICELGIPVVEDCSCSYGANYGEKRAGAYGLLTLLGLEERDILTAGGGALLYAMGRREAAVLRNYIDLPFEYRLADMNAAMAVVQFKEAERNFLKRREIAQVYQQSALRTRHKRFLQGGDAEYNNYAFPLVLETGMKDVLAYASKKEVSVEGAFSATAAAAGLVPASACPTSISLSLRTALFPLYPRLGTTQIAKVSKVIATLP